MQRAEESWRERAACRGLSPALFYPAPGPAGRADLAAARAVCASCPVAAACLADAIRTAERLGIWGGCTPAERRALRRRAERRRAGRAA
jgi:WhiB family redox-sensing transcriptional regulator